MTLACISLNKFNNSCISPHPQRNYPSGAQLSFPRKFLALKIVGKAQECDLSVTGHLIVYKPFRWLVSCSVLGCFEALPVCMLTLLAASPQPMQMLSNRHIHVCILLTRLNQEGFLPHCSVCLSHLHKISPLGVTAISSFHPSLNSQVTRAYETALFTKSRPRISQQILW